jgi:hypothetical protein
MNFKKLNVYLGWLVFLIATIVYFITIEDTVSLWDCGEYITAAYKLEVGHPPGAPLFMLIGRMFSFFADPEMVAVWINRLSGLCSSFTILFMFWSITLLTKKMILKAKSSMTVGEQIAVLGSGIVGSLAYAFTDSFWFSAVEGEVYAMSSLFTAVIFWAILKWDEEMMLAKANLLGSERSPDRWLLLIMFLLGLAIGVHLLGILVVPAITFVIYFRFREVVNLLGIFLIGILSLVILVFIQEGVIPGSIALASEFEVTFRNAMGLPFFSGSIFFFALLVVGCVVGIRFARKKKLPILYNSIMGLIMLLIGYSSFAVIVIRSNANTPLDENDPENLVTLKSYLKREQYGSAPIFFGQHWNSTENEMNEWKNRSPFYLRRFVVLDGESEIKAFRKESDALAFVKDSGKSYEITEKYFKSNAGHTENQIVTYEQTTFFPRMYNNDEPRKVEGYKAWSGYDENEDAGTELGKDGKRLPTFSENMTYFFRYQVNWMYWRYFMWNFSGRQNDIQGHGDQMAGNWISGISAIDNARLGNQDEFATSFTQDNPAHNKFYFLPLIFGLIGLIFHFYKAPKDAFVVFLAFFFTGIAIVVYLNQKTFEPRERDYAFAGSFYFFALWIGVSVYALYEAFTKFAAKVEFKQLGILFAGGLVIALVSDSGAKVSMPLTMSWLFIMGVITAVVAVMIGLRKVFKEEKQGALASIAIAGVVPVILGMQGWDDHDRSNKSTALDLAKNYLESCSKNSILFTNGDNDTFPLWYLQEVEEKRTDVRVCNLSLMQTDWYTDQMKMKAYKSEPLPIKFREDQTMMYAGKTDQVLFLSLFELNYLNASPSVLFDVVNMRIKANESAVVEELDKFVAKMSSLLSGMQVKNANLQQRVDDLKMTLTTNVKATMVENVLDKYKAGFELLSGLNGGAIELYGNNGQLFQQAMMDFEKPWDYAYIDDVMDFTRDDKNIIAYNPSNDVRIFPASGIILPVDKQNAINSGVIEKKDADKCLSELKFQFEGRYLTREQVMMMDILANNDWKRGIYFSSPYGSEVSKALYMKGYVKQNGLAFELSPLNNYRDRIDTDQMYKQLMETYQFGQMNDPGVLTDYYARRHTSQYRMHFLSLANDYMQNMEEAEQIKRQGPGYIDMLRLQNQTAEANRLEYVLNNADEIINESKKRASNLLKRSLTIMPADVVIDYGEPSPSRENFNVGSLQFQGFQDGICHEYIALLFRLGETAYANKEGIKVAKKLEQTLSYFEHSDVYFATQSDNRQVLLATLNSYLKMSMASLDPQYGDANGPFAKRTQNTLNHYFQVVFPAIETELLERAGGGSDDAMTYKALASDFRNNIDAIAIHYGLKEEPASMTKPAAQPQNDMDVDALLQQMNSGGGF